MRFSLISSSWCPPCYLKLVLVVGGLLGSLPSQGQGYAEGLSLTYEYLPLRFTAPGQPSFHADVWRASIVVPRPIAGDSAQHLLVGANVETLHFSGDPSGLAVSQVYGLAPILGYRRRFSPTLELTALALPALNSDLREVRGADLTWGGLVRVVRRVNPRLSYRATLGYRQQFYGPQYVLLLGLDWQAGSRWRLFGDLPTTFTVSYALAPRVNAGFNLLGLNTAYRLREQDQYFQYQQGHYGLFAETYLSSHWVVRATVAYAVTRRLGVFAKNDQWPATLDYVGLGTAPSPLSEPINKGLAFRFAVSYRVPQR